MYDWRHAGALGVAIMALPSSAVGGRAAKAATITVAPAVGYQTMRGWEVTTFVADACNPAFPALRDAFVDLAVNDIGIDRVRLEVRSGAENDVDYYAQYVAAGCPAPPDPDYFTWRENRYATVNDNADPGVIDPAGFHFTELDWTVENIVLPMKSAVEARGEHLHVNLNYVAFTSQIVGGSYDHDDVDEYAEFVLATYRHLEDAYGLVPDTWELVLEPDNVSQWNGTLLGEAIVASAGRLSGDGFTPRFVAPSNTSMAGAITYFDQMIAVPGALDYLEELSYHRYTGVSVANLQAIAQRAVANDLSTGMLEWWFDNGTYEVLHEDLSVGRNSAWQGSTLSGLFDADVSDPGNPVVTYRTNTRFNRQYFKFVRQGALRIEATSDDGAVEPLAFINADGGYVVVAKASTAASMVFEGLASGTYGIKYTTASAYDVDLPPVEIAAGQAAEAAIPAAGVLTVYRLGAAASAVPAASTWGVTVMALVIVGLASLLLGRVVRGGGWPKTR